MKHLRLIWGLTLTLALVLPMGVARGQTIAGGQEHSLAVMPDQMITAWGGNSYGQCVVPVPNADFVAVAAGQYHSLGLKSDGTIVAWGQNDYGQCNVPVSNGDFVAVAAGGHHSLGLKSDGTVVAWGDNSYGQCDVPAPNAGFVALAGGFWHTIGLKADGHVVIWGDSGYGQWGLPGSNSGFVAVAAGGLHNLALRGDGTIVSWGSNGDAALQVPAPNADFVAVAAGAYHCLGLKSNGIVVAWGYNTNGELNIPAPNADFTAIAAGPYHSLARKSDGTIAAWGYTSPAPVGLTAEELGIIDFTVVPSMPGAVTALLADVSSLPPGNGATFTAAPGNTMGTFRWSPALGSAGTYLISFVTVAGVVSDTVTTTLIVLPNGISARVGGAFSWLSALGAEGTYDVSFVASDQGGTSTLTIPVTTYNSGCCTGPICQDVQRRPTQTLSGRAPKTTASAPVMSWTGNPEGGYFCFPYCCYEQYPVNLNVEAYSTTPESDLDLTCPFSPPSFFITYRMTDPRLTVPATVQGTVMVPLSIDAGASDPDGDAITSLTADLSGLPPGNDAAFAESQDHSHGTMTWTPALADSGDYTVTFSVANLMYATETTSIHILGPGSVTAVETGAGSIFSARVTPNPLGVDSRLQLVTTRSGPVGVQIFDARGRLVRDVMPQQSIGPGRHQVPIPNTDASGRRLGSGIFFYRVVSSEGVLVGRLAVLK